MRSVSLLLIFASAGALAACGSHHHADVVYGTDPNAASTGRVYNSPSDYARVSNAPRPAARPARPQQAAATRPAPLTPVAAASISAAELPPAPTYVSLAEPAKTAGADGQIVTVRPGDTVYAISRRTGASPGAIIAENRLKAPYALAVGQTLRIPSAREKIANDLTERQAVRVEARAEPARTHIVRKGDTLYSISRSTGVPIQSIAAANRLRAPYELSIGQSLTIPGANGAPPAAPAQREASSAPRDVETLARTVSYTPPQASDPSRMFDWPVKGAIIGKFGAGVGGKRNDGINIAAPVGTPVRAAADGEVVYRGSELDGYGNLLLIKHADGYVTAYAHNDVMLVQKGQKVNKGQIIAKVGMTGAASEPQLHFEIRQNLKSVDPIAFLNN